jgi:hypothetical protein
MTFALQNAVVCKVNAVALFKIDDHVIPSCFRGSFQGLAFPYSIVNGGRDQLCTLF